MNQFFLASNGLFAIFLVSSSKVDSISLSRGGIFEQANPILDLSSLDALVVIGSFLLWARDGLDWITETCKLIAVIFVLVITKNEPYQSLASLHDSLIFNRWKN